MEQISLADTVALFRLLGDETRTEVIAALARSDEQLAGLAARSGRPAGVIAEAIDALRDAGLVLERRSDVPPHDVYYQLDLELLRQRYESAGFVLHPALGPARERRAAPAGPLARVLFLCTHNSARSQMAEGLLRALSRGAIESFSAGNQPGRVNPLAIETLAGMHIDIAGQRSKHYEELLHEPFDYVITVCDRAREACPVFPGQKTFAHWSIPDPAAVEGEEAQRWAFRQAATQLQTRIRYLVTLIERAHREQAVTA